MFNLEFEVLMIQKINKMKCICFLCVTYEKKTKERRISNVIKDILRIEFQDYLINTYPSRTKVWKVMKYTKIFNMFQFYSLKNNKECLDFYLNKFTCKICKKKNDFFHYDQIFLFIVFVFNVILYHNALCKFFSQYEN